MKTTKLHKKELDGRKLHDLLLKIPEDLTRITDLKHPAVASLAYAVAAMKIRQAPDEMEKQQREVDAMAGEMSSFDD